MSSLPHFMPSKDSEVLIPDEGFTSPTSRIAAIRAELLSTPYSICLERPKLLEEFWSSKEGHRSAKADHPLPVVVWIHGGGRRAGDKERCPAVPLVAKGYAVASTDF